MDTLPDLFSKESDLVGRVAACALSVQNLREFSMDEHANDDANGVGDCPECLVTLDVVVV